MTVDISQTGLKHLSPSKVAEAIERCPLRLKYTYVDRIPTQPSGNMIVGRAVHKAMEIAVEARRLGKPLPKAQELDDIFMATFKSEKAKEEAKDMGIDWDEERGDSEERMVRECRALAPVGVKEVVTKLEPEYPAELTCKEDITDPDSDEAILCWSVLDVVDKKRGVMDWKTTQKVSEFAKKLDIQMMAYGWNYRILKNATVAPVSKVFLVRNRKKPKVAVAQFKVEEHHMDFFENCAIKVWRMARSGDWLPNIGTFWCSPKWCRYYGPCRGGL